MGKMFLFFSAQYLPTAGGVERYTCNLASRLREHGHRVVVATSQLHGEPEREEDENGVEIIRLPSWHFMGGRLPVIKPGRALRKIWERDIDCAVINTYFYPLSIYAAFASRNRRIPAIVINHGSAWLMTGGRIPELMGQVYEQITSRLTYLGCKRFYGVSRLSRQWMDTFGISAQGIVTNAIDPEALEAVEEKAVDWRRVLGLDADTKIIAFVGRMIPEKGVLPLMGAMSAIRKQVPNGVLVMAGGGPLYEKFRAEPDEGVHLLGEQPYGKTLALLRQAQVFCLPSRSEGFACTVLEAAAMGCPVITTATGGSPELILDGRYGTLLPDASETAIAKACAAALLDDGWRKRAAELARKRVAECFTWEHSMHQLLEAFGLENRGKEERYEITGGYPGV